jgi:hypothetical protein
MSRLPGDCGTRIAPPGVLGSRSGHRRPILTERAVWRKDLPTGGCPVATESARAPERKQRDEDPRGPYSSSHRHKLLPCCAIREMPALKPRASHARRNQKRQLASRLSRLFLGAVRLRCMALRRPLGKPPYPLTPSLFRLLPGVLTPCTSHRRFRQSCPKCRALAVVSATFRFRAGGSSSI